MQLFLRLKKKFELKPIEVAWRSLALYAAQVPRLYALSPASEESRILGKEVDICESRLAAATEPREIQRTSLRLQEVAERHAASQQRQFELLLDGLADSIRTLAGSVYSASEESENILDDLGTVESELREAQRASTLEDVQSRLMAGLQHVGRVVERQIKVQEKLREESESATRFLAQKLETVESEGRLDMLTRVGNRTALDFYGPTMQSKVEAGEGPFSLAMIDLDGFKAINDRFGHSFGDEALRIFVGRLRPSVGDRAFIARPGGDEFVVIAPMPMQRLLVRLGRLLDSFDRSNVSICVDGKAFEAPLGFSYGCMELAIGRPLKQTIAEADAMMYEHKRQRKSQRRSA